MAKLLNYPAAEKAGLECVGLIRKLAALNKGSLTDVKFLVGESEENAQEINAFRSDLVVGSIVFRAMLNGSFLESVENVIRIKDALPKAFMHLLMYLHVFMLPMALDLNDFVELGVLADRYLVTDLLDRCATGIESLITTIDIWKTLDRVVHIPKLASVCGKKLKICDDPSLLSGPPNHFFDISKESLVFFLKLDGPQVSENFLVEQCISMHEYRKMSEQLKKYSQCL